jgi:hypothetical protein
VHMNRLFAVGAAAFLKLRHVKSRDTQPSDC